MTSNNKQFQENKSLEIYTDLKTNKSYSALRHPQANSQVEVVNKTINDNLKNKLTRLKRAWVDKLPIVL